MEKVNKEKKIEVRITTEMYTQLLQEVEQEEGTIGQIVRKALKLYFEDRQNGTK